MEQIRSYRRRGSPDFPLAIYMDDIRSAGAHPIPEYHPEIEIVRMMQGHAVIQLDGIAHTFGQGDIFIIPGNTVHYYQSFSPDAKWFSLVFSPETITMHGGHFFQTGFVQPLIEGQLTLPRLVQPTHPAYETVSAQLDALLKTRIYEKNYKLQRFSALMVICTALAPYCTAPAQERLVSDLGNESVRQCMCYIHNNHAQKRQGDRNCLPCCHFFFQQDAGKHHAHNGPEIVNDQRLGDRHHVCAGV